jgi:hypothetical protein
MSEPIYSTEDIEERFRNVFVREMARDERRCFFLADVLLSGGLQLKDKSKPKRSSSGPAPDIERFS